MKEKSWDISIPVVNELVPTPPHTLAPPRTSGTDTGTTHHQVISHPGTSSGSYLHMIIEAVKARHQFGDFPHLELPTKALCSADYKEHTLTDKETGKIMFKGAKCYGQLKRREPTKADPG